MGLSAGIRLGPYEIVSPLGAGGMGEVYKARDTRLGRDVAIKVLPESFARDAERMRRFEQEARAVAALSHPNVLAIYDTGTHEGLPYLVSELLEGETLRQRLTEGPLPARKAIEYAQQAADGLAAAHEKGIVHRDLKPENLFLTGGGRIKILDFGLAKVQAPQAAAASDGVSITREVATTPGLVMGTTGYMAPEQVRGEAVDHRADIFSFGATLYEMLSGQRAFKGDTSIETMNAILKEEPPEFDAEKLHVGPGLERIVRHCLEKKLADRFQSARDLTFALATLSGTQSTSAMRAATAKRINWMPWVAGMAVVLLLLAAYLLTQRAAPAQRAEFAIPVPGEVSHLAISADGKWLAFVSPGEKGSEPMVFVQRVGVAGARAIAGTEGASYPFWSPDDTNVAFFANGKLEKIAVAGGEPQTLATGITSGRGGTWSNKGVILYAPDAGGPLWKVNSDGSNALPFTSKLMTGREASHRWPHFLPDGDHFLMYSGNFTSDQSSNGIYLSSVSRGEKVELVPASSTVAFANGRLYYVDGNGALVSVPLDLGREKVSGEPQVVASRVALSGSTFYASFTVSQNATVVYSVSSAANLSQFTWYDPRGKELGRFGGPAVQANPALSPDGKKVAYDSNEDVWIADLDKGTSSRFTFDPAEETTPQWSRDGSTIAYRILAPPMIHLKKANGLEADRALKQTATGAAEDILANSWSLDDKEILTSQQSVTQGYHLSLAAADGTAIRTFLKSSGNMSNGQISPDGKWVAYASNESGTWEVYVTNFPGAAGKWQVSSGGGTEPRWSADGKQIFYIGAKQIVTAVPVNTAETFSAGAPQTLFAIHPRAPISSTDLYNYDVSRDGRFLVNEYVRPAVIPPLSIILRADAPAVK